MIWKYTIIKTQVLKVVSYPTSERVTVLVSAGALEELLACDSRNTTSVQIIGTCLYSCFVRSLFVKCNPPLFAMDKF
jgi:hypothetical protein